MSKSYLTLLRFKYKQARDSYRKAYLKAMGLKLAGGVSLGKIVCQWPAKLSIGNNCEIEDNVTFKVHKPFADDNYIQIGSRVFIGNHCEFNCNTRIVVGDDCLIASHTTFVDTGHEIAAGVNINKQPCTIKEIIIGNDVWIGTHCIILKGVTIGNGSVIGAGSVVNKSIPGNQVWAGTPAKFIRNRN